ncbi:MAG: AsmA-like C-terminal region-containing protein, partial [Burkholderiales bacterium]
AKIGRANIKGSSRASWGGGIRVEGDFAVTNGELAQLMANFTRQFTASGTLTANASYSLQGTTLQNLFADPRVEASFNIEKGSINNVDIIRAIQIPSRDGVRGGKTGFNTFAGSMRLANKTYSYRQLQLSSGPMNASGNVDVEPNGNLSGRISTQLGSKTVIVARGNLVVTGSLKTPVLK